MAETPSAQVDVDEHPGLECPECGDTIRGSGKMPDKTALGGHRKRKHGVSGSADSSARARARRRQPAETAEDRDASVTPLSIVRQAADTVGGRGVPSGRQLGTGLGTAYGLTSLFVTSLIVDTDDRLTEQQRTDAIAFLAPSDSEALATMAPIGRVLSRTSLNRRYGRTFLDNLDVLDSIEAMAQQAARWRRYMTERRAGVAPTLGATIEAGPGPAPMSNAFVPGVTGPVEGRVIGPADLGRRDLVDDAAARQVGEP